MGTAWTTRRQIKERISDIVGVRTGLALGDKRIDEEIERTIPLLHPEPNGLFPVRANLIEDITFDLLKSCGDRWMEFGRFPQVTAYQRIGEDSDLLGYAMNLIHREVHFQALSDDLMEHPYSEGRCNVYSATRANQIVASVDVYVLSANLDRIDEQAILGRALIERGIEGRRACDLLLGAYRCSQRMNPWLKVNTVQLVVFALR